MTFTNDGTKISLSFLWSSTLIPQLYIVNNTITRYKLIRIDFHNALVNNTGSEHSIDGTTYDMEAQLVFSNVAYTDSDAINHSDGYAIVSKLFTALTTVTVATTQYDTWSILLQFVMQPGSTYTSSYPWVNSLADILGNIFFTFYQYSGSFTQPGCQEVVSWYVGKTPVGIQFPQVGKFRYPLNTALGTIAPNDRPVQALNGRTVLLNSIPYFP